MYNNYGFPYYFSKEVYLKGKAIYNKTRKAIFDFNSVFQPDGHSEYHINILKEILGNFGEDSQVLQPFCIDHGINTYIGKNTFINHNCTILDGAKVFIGDNVRIAPDVGIYTDTHPVHPIPRRDIVDSNSKPITIHNNVWIGGHSTILPGVTIGENSVIGGGSVVTKDIPDNVVAVGNPCRVLYKITDDIKYQLDKNTMITKEDWENGLHWQETKKEYKKML